MPPWLYQTLYQERGLFRNRYARPILEDMWTLTCTSLTANSKTGEIIGQVRQKGLVTTLLVLAPKYLLVKGRELARECLELIESIRAHNSSLNGGDLRSQDRAISDELVSALNLFIQHPPVEHLNHYRY